jgi:CBS domain-containing protein
VEESYEIILQEPVTMAMTQCPLPIHPDTSLFEVFEQFSRQSNHPIIVINPDNTLAGVITPMDIISVLTPGEAAGGRYLISELDRLLKSIAHSASDLLSDEPLTVSEDAKIRDALLAMEHGHSSSVIVVNRKMEPVGCINLSDIIAFLIRSLSH